MIDNKLIDVLKSGGIAVVPTDTIYGIIADATNEAAVEKVFKAKERTFNKPLLVLINNYEMLNEYVSEVNEIERALIEKFWPGPLTILFNKNDKINDLVTSNNVTVGVRMPNNEFLRNLINEVGNPLVSTSANISNNSVINSITELDINLRKKMDYIYDGGVLGNLSSTIVQVRDGKIYILRDGKLTKEIKDKFKDYL